MTQNNITKENNMNNLWKKYPDEKPPIHKSFYMNREDNQKFSREFFIKQSNLDSFLIRYKAKYWCYESDLIASINAPKADNSELVEDIDNETIMLNEYIRRSLNTGYKQKARRLIKVMAKCKAALSGKSGE